MKNYLVMAGIGLAMALVVVSFVKPVQKVINQTTGANLGALAGPDIPSGYLRWGGGNGVRVWPTGRALTQGTTTVCSILSPAATSTLLSAGLKLDVASSSATLVEFGQSTSVPTATTTRIGTAYVVAGGASAFIAASTSPTTGATTVFAPNTYLNIKVQGGVTLGDSATAAGAAGFVPTGACQATFEEYPTI